MAASTNKLTKAQVIAALAEGSGLDKKEVTNLLEALGNLIKKELGSHGPGEVTIPNLIKLKAKATAATPEKQGVNPFTKKPTVIKAKPASLKVRVTPVKALKDMIS